MSENKCFLVLVVLTCLWTLSRGDPEVTCVLSSSCLLPCQFQFGSDPVIHWIYLISGNPHIHSYYNDQDQLQYQDQRFRGRTSLFKDQISKGNASVLLRGVKVQDEGRYKCYTSTTRGNEVSFINLKAEAPVTEVNIYQEGNRITCSSEGIYPEPELTWSTIPPSNMELQNRTRVQQTEEQLYSISSSLMVSDRDPDLSYSCSIRTQRNLRNQRTATLNKPTSVDGLNIETTIPCCSSNVSISSFTWRFNHSQLILTKTEGETSTKVSEEWRKHVEEVSESGSLTLQDLTSDQEGVYTCEARNKEETIISNILLRISPAGFLNRLNKRKLSEVGIVVFIVVATGVIVLVVFMVWHKKRKADKDQKNRQGKSKETSSAEDQLNTGGTSNNTPVPQKNDNTQITPMSDLSSTETSNQKQDKSNETSSAEDRSTAGGNSNNTSIPPNKEITEVTPMLDPSSTETNNQKQDKSNETSSADDRSTAGGTSNNTPVPQKKENTEGTPVSDLSSTETNNQKQDESNETSSADDRSNAGGTSNNTPVPQKKEITEVTPMLDPSSTETNNQKQDESNETSSADDRSNAGGTSNNTPVPQKKEITEDAPLLNSNSKS